MLEDGVPVDRVSIPFVEIREFVVMLPEFVKMLIGALAAPMVLLTCRSISTPDAVVLLPILMMPWLCILPTSITLPVPGFIVSVPVPRVRL